MVRERVGLAAMATLPSWIFDEIFFANTLFTIAAKAIHAQVHLAKCGLNRLKTLGALFYMRRLPMTQ